MIRRAVLVATCCALACEATGFDNEYTVDTLRVLAIQADLPFAQPNETVHLTTLEADPLGAGRPIQWAWGTCVNPSSAQIPDCAAALQSLALGTDSFVATVPANALDGVPAGEFGIVFAVCAGALTLVPNATGAPVTCTDSSGAAIGREGFMWGGTRVTVVDGLRNANPVIAQILIDGAPWDEGSTPAIESCAATDSSDCPASAQHVFSYVATPDSAETYDIGQGPTTEQLVGWFYVTQGTLTAGYANPDVSDAGAITSPPTFEMPYAPTKSDPTTPVTVWFVLRDDRGGLAFAERQLSWK